MRRVVFVLVAVGALAGVVAYLAPASGQADGEAAPIFGVRPWRRTDSGCCFDHLPGVVVLELGGAQIAEG